MKMSTCKEGVVGPECEDAHPCAVSLRCLPWVPVLCTQSCPSSSRIGSLLEGFPSCSAWFGGLRTCRYLCVFRANCNEGCLVHRKWINRCERVCDQRLVKMTKRMEAWPWAAGKGRDLSENTEQLYELGSADPGWVGRWAAVSKRTVLKQGRGTSFSRNLSVWECSWAQCVEGGKTTGNDSDPKAIRARRATGDEKETLGEACTMLSPSWDSLCDVGGGLSLPWTGRLFFLFLFFKTF